MLSPKIRETIRFFREKLNIDLEKSPCFNCPIEKKGLPCLNPKECNLLNEWIENLRDNEK